MYYYYSPCVSYARCVDAERLYVYALHSHTAIELRTISRFLAFVLLRRCGVFLIAVLQAVHLHYTNSCTVLIHVNVCHTDVLR